jgi:Pyruvate/2-oxoacid:ferredoxin oxidoreductase delta subunit
MTRKSLFQSITSAFGLAAESDEGRSEKHVQMGRVVSDASRCVQCGVCGYNCPVGISVRDYARQGLPVDDPRCITCGICVNVCPRGTLRWETEAHVIVAGRLVELIDSSGGRKEP